jgi:outer membrane receptor protein involved in Fe transport
MKFILTLLFAGILCTCVRAQSVMRGQVQDADGAAVAFANAALYTSDDSTLTKVETTDDAGLFALRNVPVGTYDLVITYIGAPELRRPGIEVSEDVDLGVLKLAPAAVELAEATVTARRALVEVKPDRTVFNVEGTINAVGNNGLDLLRKAPGVTVDNNDNINVLSRSGVLLYVDGRRLPLSGQDLSNYLRNLTAEQIDRIDIITNPGARYEAEGNAGIIDIRLKKAEDEGANATVSLNASQGRYFRGGVDINGNYRNRWVNVFGNLGYNEGENFNETFFNSFQNGLRLDEQIFSRNDNLNPSYRLGADFYLNEKQIIGILVGGRYTDATQRTRDEIDIYDRRSGTEVFDSTLLATTIGDTDRGQNTINLNYRYRIGEGRNLNVDLDYGRFRNDDLVDLTNDYFDVEGQPLTTIGTFFDTPTDIDIYTAQLDYELPLWGGGADAGARFSRVRTFNTFLFYDVEFQPQRTLARDDQQSNLFDYSEDVYAVYGSYQGQWNERWKYTAGLRMEITDATGELTPFDENLQQDPVELNYVSFFPNAGVTYALDARKGNTLNLSYGRRINRPDYNVLNPFRKQISELSFESGNPSLNPEIVDNIELGYTHAYRYNFKLAYSHTANQITRLIGPDSTDARAGFIGWDNLASQTVLAFNASAPVQVTEKFNVYVNASASYIDNQADYGEGEGSIDLQVFSYSFFVQNTLSLPGDFTFEFGGYFSGPGVWGGVFRYNELGAFNVGLQKKFLNDQLNVKLSGNDLFFTSGWDGYSEFNGLLSEGNGNWDSRRVGLSLSYSFGNQKVKSRKRNTGIEEAAKRVN